MYQSFAYVYDKFMENVPYEEWVNYIQEVWNHFNIKPKLVADLACGTGQMTIDLAKKGYDMIGIDLSFEMLDVARQKASDKDVNILFLQQDMRDFELYGTVQSIICACDSINYILSEDEVLDVFKLVNNYLDPGGLFIFDINTEYKYKYILGENTFTDVQEDCAYIWDNYYDDKEMINEYSLTIFNEEDSGLYRKYEELHFQRAHKIDKISELIKKSGLQLVAVYDAFTFNEPTNESERIFFVAREIGKEEKKC